MVPILSEKFNLLRYDCRGQGESPCPKLEIYSLEDHVSDLSLLLDFLKIKECCFFGLSNGARVAMEFACQFPSRARAVICADGFDVASPLLKLKLGSWLKAHEVGGDLLRFDIATPWVWGESLVAKKPELVDYYRKRAEKRESYVVSALIKGALKGDIDTCLIDCRVLFLVGKEDLLTPPFLCEKMHFKRLEKGLESHFEIIDGGHAAPLEYPHRSARRILKFLNEQ